MFEHLRTRSTSSNLIKSTDDLWGYDDLADKDKLRVLKLLGIEEQEEEPEKMALDKIEEDKENIITANITPSTPSSEKQQQPEPKPRRIAKRRAKTTASNCQT